ncbi:MAG: flavodoxin family protein [Thermanaeromonas sp.]|uniref:flavodoxin family protein n=1 Tax=Thermanaeromonas sp. TaxID=2003697 RepID=UPI00243929EB|nr:flavodoxin family protein [Thermanaeromonas sp.]MCG0278617.1 flavodoxin family protein [Thermanaeromonas sp.]
MRSLPKVIAINGSHRKGRNTAALLLAVLEGAQEEGAAIELIELVDYNIKPCLGCNRCVGKSQCTINDDDMTKLAEKLLQADGIVLGSPVYFGNVTGRMKVFMDRTRWLYLSKSLLSGKVGAAVTHAALRNGGQELVHLVLERFLIMHGMLVATSRNPDGAVYNNGATGTLFRAIESDGEIIWRRSVGDDELALRECRQLGRNVMKLVKQLKESYGVG